MAEAVLEGVGWDAAQEQEDIVAEFGRFMRSTLKLASVSGMSALFYRD